MPIDIFGRTSNTSSKSQRSATLYFDTKHFLRHDGSVSATSSLDMAGNSINNLPFPDNQTDAANRDYVDTKINNLDSELRRYIDIKVYEVVNAMYGNTIQPIQYGNTIQPIQ